MSLKLKISFESLYGNTEELITAKNPSDDSLYSEFSPAQIFIGEYWDDFALPVFFCNTKHQSVLILGLGLGAGIRPLIATGMVANVTAVDVDINFINSAKKIYETNFSGLNVKIIHDDAEQFVSKHLEKYDLIWIDLYDEQGLPEFLTKPLFYEKLHRILNNSGVVAINLFTVPAHLRQLEGGTMPLQVSKLLTQSGFTLQFGIPYRQNFTLVARQNSSLTYISPQHLEISELNQMLRTKDQAGLLLQSLRARFASEVSIRDFGFNKGWNTFSARNAMCKERWTEFLREFFHFTTDETLSIFKINSWGDLIELMKNPNTAPSFLEEIYMSSPIFARVFPVYISSRTSFSDSPDYSWYPKWVFCNLPKLIAIDEQEAILFHLTQAVSMVIHISAKYHELLPLAFDALRVAMESTPHKKSTPNDFITKI